jgi:CHAT domain-containing protein/tetratricopeptide (TPR) repeat protein
MTQNNLANAYSDRIKGDRADNLERAIGYYQAALEVYTRQAFPQDWAMTQNNLAVAYRNRIKGDRADNLERAIGYYQAALAVRTREAFPEQWAGTQNNLAAAYSDRIKGDRADNLERAIGYFQAALEVYTPATFPLDCLQTGRNLGNLGYHQQNWEIAILGYDNAIRAVEQSRNWTTSPQRKRQILEEALPIYGKMIQACIYLERYDQALLTVERSKSRTLIELLHNADLVPKNATPEQQQRYRQLNREIAALQQSFGDEPSSQMLRPDGIFIGGIQWLINGIRWLIAKILRPGSDNQSSDSHNESVTDEPVGAKHSGSQSSDSHNESSSRMLRPGSDNQSSDKNQLQQLQHLLQQRDELLAEINDPEFNAIKEINPQLPDFSQILTPEPPLAPPSKGGELKEGGTALIEWYLPQDANLGGYVFIVTLEFTPEISPKSHRHHIQTHHYTAEQRQALDQFNQTYFADYRETTTWFQQLTPRLAQLAQLLDLDELLGKIPPTCNQLILVPHLYLHLFPLHGLAGCRVSVVGERGSGGAGEQGSRGAGEIFFSSSPLPTTIPSAPLPLIPPAPLHPQPLSHLFPEGIRYAPSCQILAYLQNRQQQNRQEQGTPPNPPLSRGGTGQQFFAVENPTQDLPYTEMEVEFIRESFDPHTYILKNTDASKSALNSPETLAKLRESVFAHFACHGGFDSENPLNSALILAGDAPTPPSPPSTGGKKERYLTLRDGRRFDTEHQGLTLREIYANLELPACRLVMLSACETGLLDSQLTDEYIGLVSGFLHAGSPSVVSSFWCVDDFATALLSIRFYQEFTPETTVAKALQSAQTWLQTRTKSDLLAWCAKDLKMSEDEMDEMAYQLMDYDDIPFEDMRYWLAFFASGL